MKFLVLAFLLFVVFRVKRARERGRACCGLVTLGGVMVAHEGLGCVR